VSEAKSNHETISRQSRQSAKRKPTKPGKTNGGLASLMSAHGDLIVCLSLVAVVFLCFANALRNEFVFDDIYLVSVNKTDFEA